MIEHRRPGFHLHQISLQTLEQWDVHTALDHSLQQLTLTINPLDLATKGTEQALGWSLGVAWKHRH